MRYAFAILSLFVLVALASGQAYVDGQVADGYTHRGGYWWWGNDAYTRRLVQAPSYTSCGRCYPGASYYQYTYSHAYQAPLTYKDPDWKTRLLGIAAERDKVEMEIRKGAFEQQYFTEAVRALGLEGNFRLHAYGATPPYTYPVQQSLAYSSAGVNGSTVYGYTYNQRADVYGDLNVSQLYQQSARHVDTAQQFGAQAVQGHQALVGQAGENQARVAEILAKGSVLNNVAKSLDTNRTTIQTQSTTFKVGPGETGVQPSLWEQSAGRCIECHSGTRKEGGFDVTTYQQLPPEIKLKKFARLITDDESKRMPRTSSGAAGPRIEGAELQSWIK